MDRHEPGALDVVDELVYPTHPREVEVRGRQPSPRLVPSPLARALEHRHEQCLPGLVEQSLKCWGLYLEPDVRGVVQHPDHRFVCIVYEALQTVFLLLGSLKRIYHRFVRSKVVRLY